MKSVLIIGASGRTGVQLIQQLTQRNFSKASIFAFCRDLTKIDKHTLALCDGVYQGDAMVKDDLEKAINDSKAEVVVMSIGNGDNVGKTDIRTASAKALVAVLSKPKYQQVKVCVISSNGAGGSRIRVGYGIGRIIEFHLRHILTDHTGQENAFRVASFKDRVMIVRPTALVDNQKEAGHYVIKIFGDLEKPPSIQTDRAVLAEWISKHICEEESMVTFGCTPSNVTCIASN